MWVTLVITAATARSTVRMIVSTMSPVRCGTASRTARIRSGTNEASTAIRHTESTAARRLRILTMVAVRHLEVTSCHGLTGSVNIRYPSSFSSPW